jgi:CheY-like chemotaxis protein
MDDIQPKKILIVDDEIDILAHLANFLKRAGYQVFFTDKGKEALQIVAQESPDLVILDLILPDIFGGDVAAELAKNPSTASIPIVFLTGLLTKGEEEGFKKKYGKHHIMAKPIIPADLETLLKKILS